MWFLRTLWLVDRLVDRIILTMEDRILFGPHAMDNLAGLAERAHAVAGLGKAVAIGLPFVLVPPRTDAAQQPAMAHDVDGRRDFRQEGRVTIAVAGDHLADLDVLRV